MLQVADEPLLLETIKVEIEKSRGGQGQCNRFKLSRRVDARDQTDQIAAQNEKEDDGREALKALIAMPDDLVGLTADEFVDHLGKLLHRRRLFDAQRQPHRDEK